MVVVDVCDSGLVPVVVVVIDVLASVCQEYLSKSCYVGDLGIS